MMLHIHDMITEMRTFWEHRHHQPFMNAVIYSCHSIILCNWQGDALADCSTLTVSSRSSQHKERDLVRIQLECCACLRRHVMKKGHDYERRFCCFIGCSVIGCCMIQLVFTYHSILQSLLHYKSRLEKITLLRSHGCDNKVCKVVYFWGIPCRHYQLVVAVRGMTATIVRCELTLTLKQHVGLGLIMFRPNGGVMFVMDYLTVFMFFHPPTGPRIR